MPLIRAGLGNSRQLLSLKTRQLRAMRPAAGIAMAAMMLVGCASSYNNPLGYGPYHTVDAGSTIGGTLVGAAAGGLIGSTIGSGGGNLAATAAGTLVGAAIGGQIGSQANYSGFAGTGFERGPSRIGAGTVGGGLVGAAAGGLIGSQFGSGSGRLAATAAGTLIGAGLGASVGSSYDRQYYQSGNIPHYTPGGYVYRGDAYNNAYLIGQGPVVPNTIQNNVFSIPAVQYQYPAYREVVWQPVSDVTVYKQGTAPLQQHGCAQVHNPNGRMLHYCPDRFGGWSLRP